jgi:arylsulfatase A-like enzyme
MKPTHRIINSLAILLLLCLSATLGAAAEKPMNVLMLISDDLNSWLLENPERYTGKVIAPNLKALGESGVNFKYAYTAAPVCSPSRTAFFSGVAPWKSGVYNNAQTISKSEALNQDAVLSLAGLFKKGGYAPSVTAKSPTAGTRKSIGMIMSATKETRLLPARLWPNSAEESRIGDPSISPRSK